MLKIRICWHPDFEHEERGVFRDGGFWYLDGADMRSSLMALVQSWNIAHGPGSHWLEERPYDGEPLPIYH
ncbi:hypothetical protein [Variovorax guangxiensis]|uniref:Uncharacterized protein n=1 Tax=Variovorax guangxiensis TaxID=1775474 RepID=A0A502E0N6_9BURK|nr:hypothetical protein [Variovorax guangxiensis]TPG26547.1 hypothetical protein EAH83_01890 [Variovorax ginsengisoli]TPG30272.1 hypothetical protein EAH82_01890 [Variovorax guangxiensis]